MIWKPILVGVLILIAYALLFYFVAVDMVIRLS